MRVRPMSPADADALADFVATVPGSVDPGHELTRPEARAWVACDAGSEVPLAYVVCSSVVDEIELLALGTRPEARQRGLARALLHRVISFAGESGARRVCLEVGAKNEAARRLYESAGFAMFNVRRAYYRETGEDALEMELKLAAP
jgi:[ribosomal protein S18]-alanine N-acetyltransferase